MKRRLFVRRLAGVGALGTLARQSPGGSALTQEPGDEPKPDPLNAEVEARLALVLARYPSQLDEAARKTIRDDIRQLVRRGQRLRAFALENGDEPLPVFAPFRDNA